MFKTNKKSNNDSIQKTVKRSLDFETTLVDIRKKSEKRAWVVAGVFCLFFFMFAWWFILYFTFKRERALSCYGRCLYRASDCC